MSCDDAIKRTFDQVFEDVPFVAPPVVVARRRPWRIWSGSSCIDFVFGSSQGRDYLEYSAISKFVWGTRRGRIYCDGSLQRLEGEQDVVVVDPGVPGDAEEQEKRRQEHNARIAREMEAAGFRDGPDHSLFKDALSHAAAELEDQLPQIVSSETPEKVFRLIFQRALQQEVGDLLELEKRIDLGEGWPNLPPRKLGGVDILVRYRTSTARGH